jgi:hypothetical protein
MTSGKWQAVEPGTLQKHEACFTKKSLAEDKTA